MSDGRFDRTTRTDAAILDAFISLVHEQSAQPTMDAVAEAAAISVRTLYRHYPEASSVVVAALARSLAATVAPAIPVTASRPLGDRVAALVTAWSGTAESNLVLWSLATATSVDDPDIVDSLVASRAAGRAQLRALFARELARRDAPMRSIVLDAVESAVSLAGWYGLRIDQGLAPSRARRITESLVAGVLAGR